MAHESQYIYIYIYIYIYMYITLGKKNCIVVRFYFLPFLIINSFWWRYFHSEAFLSDFLLSILLHLIYFSFNIVCPYGVVRWAAIRRDETINPIISEYSKLVQREFKIRRDWVGKDSINESSGSVGKVFDITASTILLLIWEFFIPVSADGFQLESKWQQVTTSLQDSS